MPLVFPQFLPSSMIDPRQSTTVPKVSNRSAFTGARARVVSCAPRKAKAAAPIPADLATCLRVIIEVLFTFQRKRATREIQSRCRAAKEWSHSPGQQQERRAHLAA